MSDEPCAADILGLSAAMNIADERGHGFPGKRHWPGSLASARPAQRATERMTQSAR